MSGRHVFTMLFIIAALSILAVASAPDAHAAGLITVTNTLDETTNGDGCSLREAISNANNNAQTYTDCTSGSGADTINFSVSGTITLTSMLPAITDNVTIDGTGQAISVSGGDSARVMQVNGGKTLHLTNIVITHGKAPDGGNTDNPGGDGGGLYNSGTAIITGSTFSYNASGNAGTFGGGADGGKGGAIFNAGTLNVSNSLFDHNSAGLGVSGYNQEGKQGPGGAIYNLSQLTVTGSTFSNNDAGLGGGIENFGATATVSGTTFTGNTADLGGGFSNYFGGGFTVTNSTVYNNSASDEGGGVWSDGIITIVNATIAHNGAPSGGGLYLETGTFTVRNTILAGSTSGGNCATMAPTSPMFTDGGYNIDDGTTCGFSAANHSQPGTNPDLDSGNLQNNGGPTQTIALQSDSPAINTIPAGVNSCGASVTSDQRGVARPQSANCDTGAFEASFITGYKFNDLNGNGQKDGGEPGLQGWTIRLEDTSNNVLSSTTTVAGGYYTLTISTLPATYRVREVQQPGWTQTSPNLADVPLTINTPGAGGEAIGNVFPADLSIVKSWAKSQTSALVGTYTLMVTNAGPNVAKNVVVTDPFPAQVALQSSTTSRGTCAYKLLSRTVTCKLGTMPVNATATIQLKVRVSNATGNFTNCASVASGTFDVNSNNNQSCVTLTPSLQQVTLAASDLSHALLAEVGAGGVGRLAGFVTMLLPGLTSWPVFST